MAGKRRHKLKTFLQIRELLKRPKLNKEKIVINLKNNKLGDNCFATKKVP